MNLLHWVTATAVAFLVCASTAHATTVVPPTLDELVEWSDSIIRTRVTSTRCEWRGDGEERRIVTLVTYAVDESIVGSSAATAELEFFGGEIDGEQMFIAGQPKFRPGDEDILFVSRERNIFTPLVRMMYGRYMVADRENGSRLVARANGMPLIALDQIAAPLERPASGEALAMLVDAALTPEAFGEAIRESARRHGRTDITEPTEGAHK